MYVETRPAIIESRISCYGRSVSNRTRVCLRVVESIKAGHTETRITSCKRSDNLVLTIHAAGLVLHIVFRRNCNRGGCVSPGQDVAYGKAAGGADIVGEIHVNPPAIEIRDIARHVPAQLL